MTSTTFGAGFDAKKLDQPMFFQSDPSTVDNQSDKRGVFMNTFSLNMNHGQKPTGSLVPLEQLHQSYIEEKKRKIMEYKAFADDYYSTSMLIKKQQMIGESDRRLMDQIKMHERNDKKSDLYRNKI